jgi:hypothetical protein
MSKPAAPSPVVSDGYEDLIKYDTIRVTTEAHHSEALFCPGPHGPTIFYKNELIRLCGCRGDVCFAVPYLVDPTDHRTVTPHYIMTRQFRELNPAERAILGLPLFGNWDQVTRYGLKEGGEIATANGHRRLAAAMHHCFDQGDLGRAARFGTQLGEPSLDPKRDPRLFEIGDLFIRGIPDSQPLAVRELHPWPIAYRVHTRTLAQTDADWQLEVVPPRGDQPARAAEGLSLREMEELTRELHRREMHERRLALAEGRERPQTVLKVTRSVSLPTPYEPRGARDADKSTKEN